MAKKISRTRFIKEEKFIDFPMKISRIVGRKKGPKVLIISGVHGGETSSIQVVYELIDMIWERQDIAGEVTIIPIVNLPAVLARTRESPLDYKNLNGVYPKTLQQTSTFSNILRYHIEKLAKEHDFLIDLHSSTAGIFVQHVCPTSDEKVPLDLAREFGSEFVLIRETTGSGNQLRNLRQEETLEEGADIIAASVSRSSKTLGFSFEVGSGTIISSLYTKAAKAMILRFLSKIGVISNFQTKYPLRKTPKSRIFTPEDTVQLTAPCYGDVFFYKGVGKVFKRKEPLGYVLNFTTLQKTELFAPILGQFYFRRFTTQIKPQYSKSTTLASFIPTKNIHNEFVYSRLARRKGK